MTNANPRDVAAARTSSPPPFVSHDAGRLRRAFATPPTDALVAMPPMHGESSPILERAREQFGVFCKRLDVAGTKLAPAPVVDRPLDAACADLAVVFADGAFLMRPSDLRRRGEVPALERALAAANVPIVGRIEAPGLLDGGDVLLAPDTAYVGVARARRSEVGIRVQARGNAFGREQLAAYARAKGLRAVEIPINADVLRLRSVAALVASETLLFAPGVMDGSGFANLELLEVPRGEEYGAGVLALGERRVLANLRFRLTIPLLRKAKIAIDAIDLWEFGKVGVTPSLLALAIERG